MGKKSSKHKHQGKETSDSRADRRTRRRAERDMRESIKNGTETADAGKKGLAYYKGPARPEHSTPQDFFDKLNAKYNFTLDPCANKENRKCDYWFGPKSPFATDGLTTSWAGHNVFMNPPYGNEIKHWVEKAYVESQQDDTVIVGLLPARTDTKWFHDFVYHKTEIVFIKGRLSFSDAGPAPFPSMIVRWR